MSLGLWPDAVPFDPEGGTASHELKARLDLATAPAAMLLVSGGSEQRSDWAGRTAAAVARALAEDGRPVVLADLDFEVATLHALFGEVNVEGVADVVLFGSSLERVATRPAGENFNLIPPGAFAPDPAEILLDPGWSRVLADFEASGGTWLGYLAADAAGAEFIADRIRTVIVLCAENQAAATVAKLPENILLRAILSPASPSAAPVQPSSENRSVLEPEPEFVTATPVLVEPIADTVSFSTPDRPLEAGPVVSHVDVRPEADPVLRAMIEDVRGRQSRASARAARAAGHVAVAETTLESLPAPDAMPARRSPPGRDARWPIGLLALAVLTVLIAGALFGRRYLASRADPDSPGTAVNPDATEEPRGRPLTYSVAIESHDQLARAVQRADSLAAAYQQSAFYIAPFRLDGATYYRVLAGPLADSASAAALMQALVVSGAKTAVSEGDVRETPLAFLIGAYDVRVDADARRNELRESGVPSYVVEVPYTRGPLRYHLYAGAYNRPSEAEAMRGILRNAGVPDTLVVRIGQVGT